MDCLDVDMHLPPRKRLLAGLRREKSSADALPPIPFFSSDLGAHVRLVINSLISNPANIVEVSKSVVAATVKIATTSRDTAMEKAATAARARAAAKNALEFLDSITRDRTLKRNLLVKNKVKKEVLIKLFYKMQSLRSDEDLARRLHHDMNSSPRISNSKQKNDRSSATDFASDDGALNSRNVSICGNETTKIINEPLLDQMEEKIVVRSEVSIFHEEEEEKEELLLRKTKKNLGKAREVPVGRKPKIKRKKLSMSQYDASINRVQAPITKQQKLACEEEKDVCSSDVKPLDDASAIVKITSLWKCNKLKMTKSSSNLPALCLQLSSTTALSDSCIS